MDRIPMAESIGIGWRLESESGGGMNRNRVAACAGIRTYKVVWFIGVIIPMMVTGRFPNYAIFTAVTFATYIIGDLIAIPFSYVFAKEADD